MQYERNKARKQGYEDPVCSTKEETSTNYHKAVDTIINNLTHNDKIFSIFATHNIDTIKYILQQLKYYNISNDNKNIAFSQLYGMRDYISYTLSKNNYVVYKWIPYGNIQLVIPYLIRRALENSDAMSGVDIEINYFYNEIKKRLFNY
jgi:hypothetical protein